MEEKFVRPAMFGDLQARSQAIPAKAIWSHLASQNAYRLSFPKEKLSSTRDCASTDIQICIFIWQKKIEKPLLSAFIERAVSNVQVGLIYFLSWLFFLALRSFQGGGGDCRRVTPIWRLIWYLVFIANGNRIDYGTFEGVGEDKGHTPFPLSCLLSWLTRAPETVIYCQV